MSTPPPVPPIVDQDRVQSYSIVAPTPTIALAYPLFGDGTDIIITVNEAVLSPSLYAVSSISGGSNLDILPLPITDGLVTFSPELTTGEVVITYSWAPRTPVLPTAPGISREEFNIDYTQVVASLREIRYLINSLNLTPINISALLDAGFGSTPGNVLIRGASVWQGENLGVGPLPVVSSGAALEALSTAGLISGQLVYLQGAVGTGDLFRLVTSSPGPADGVTIIWSNTTGFFYVRQVTAQPALVLAALGGVPLTSTSLVPSGAMMSFPFSAAPAGWLASSGQLVSRTTYAALWVAAQASGNIVSDATWTGGAGLYDGSFSTGDGSTTFRLPYANGNFIRSWDNGRGVDSGRALGTMQLDALQDHTHAVSGQAANPISPASSPNLEPSGAAQSGLASASGARTATETRPRNIALLTCIKT